jgi:uncharacterized protein YkwD
MVQGGKGVWHGTSNQTMSVARIKMRRSILTAILAVAIAFGAAGAQAQDGREDLQGVALELANQSRAASGLPPLSLEPALTRAARTHAEDMLRRGFFAHVSPDGETALDRYLRSGGARGRLVAENIAECRNCVAGREVVRNLHRGWMESAGHRANILSPGVERFGFGVAESGGRVVAVQTFAGPGTSGGLAPAGEAKPLDHAGQLRAAMELLNRARRKAGVRPVEGSAALSKALRQTLGSDETGAELRLPPLSAILSALSENEASSVRDAALVAGQCGGCGTAATAADVAFFIEGWLSDPDYQSTLLDPRWSELGAVVEADGKGRKRALAILAASAG